jgi:pimeloyl-ACP methyl ester carboxylesterase
MTGIRAVWAAFVLSALAAAQTTVTLTPSDGGTIYADAYGDGDRGLVLAHGGGFLKQGWRPQATVLAAAGFRILAIDYRGEGRSRAGGEGRPSDEARPLDVLAAVHYLRERGAKSVAVVGASMGGDYAADAAEAEPAAIDRLVLLASGEYTTVSRMKGPKLFILARGDTGSAGPRLPRIRARYEQASGPKEWIVLDGSAHAQYLFATDQGDRLMREILRFLAGK